MRKSNRFSARLRKSMGQGELLQKRTPVLGAQQERQTPGGLIVPKNTPDPTPKPPPDPVKQPSLMDAPKASLGKKVRTAAKNVATGQKGFGTRTEGKVKGAAKDVLGKIGEGFKTELGNFRRDQAGIGGGPAKPPQQSEADQDMFAQQTGRKQTQQTKRNQRMYQRMSASGGQAGGKSPQNVQNRQPVGQIKSFNPALASLLAVSAGFAASDAVVNASGARGARSITDDQLNLFNVMANKKRGKKLRKEHSPLPPIQGLVWDEGAKRWRKPENVGKTASEVQGKKRIRGSALGQTAKSPGGTSAGKGRGRGYSKGRAQRIATGDIGVAGIPGSKTASKKRRRRK